MGSSPSTSSPSISVADRWIDVIPRYVTHGGQVCALTVGIRHPPLRSPEITMAENGKLFFTSDLRDPPLDRLGYEVCRSSSVGQASDCRDLSADALSTGNHQGRRWVGSIW